jgi:patatin-like phospholipase/acyl hydrolase
VSPHGSGKKHYVILSIDGGGVRGIIPAAMIKRFAEDIPAGFLRKADLLAGTSTGALIALLIGAGMEPNEVLDLYIGHAKEIFSRSWWRTLSSLNGLVRAKYNNDGLRRVLDSVFSPGFKLGELKHKVFVPSFRLDGSEERGGTRRWHPVFFTTPLGAHILKS